MLKYLTPAIAVLALTIAVANATGELIPTGNPVLNQIIQLRAVTPSDSTVLPQTRGLHNGAATACNVAVIGVRDTAAVTIKNIQSGADVPISVTKVMSTNTTCTDILAYY